MTDLFPAYEVGPNLFLVDVEASDRTPMTGYMTEFAAVHVRSGASLYAQLYAFHPDADIPAIPVVERDDAGEPIALIRVEVDGIDQGEVSSHAAVAGMLSTWLTMQAGGDKGALVSDNPTYDGMWINCFLDQHGQGGALGFSGRRIGDFAAGLASKWNDHNSWKSLRETTHTHHPRDDAMGNAEALIKLVRSSRAS